MLKQLRQQRGMTQGQLATAVGVHRSAITHFERGSAQPSLSVALNISRVLDSTVEELFGPAILPQLPSEVTK